ncbi:hypothetical protein OLMES_2668 [Oleiphilus messinensis]|uniref:Uncharacterized protein n=1 Tax=Oleiphilus messinensis TaxID=141451 RepID=A0A1Y0I897_9GAMM|nr:hypothetical protein [Oleiphilus messinensis]ARU56718.1 hypothetical protein OLMES_2668 [Oleiphilus messinensis]
MNWPIDNAEWLKNRKQAWLELKANSIDVLTWFRSKDLKQVRHYFLTGEEDQDNPLPDYSHGKRLAKYPVPLFIKIWFYPEPSLEYFRSLLSHAGIRDIRDCYHSIGLSNFPQYNTDYGMMGGREEVVFYALYGNTFEEYRSLPFALPETELGFANQFGGYQAVIFWLLQGYPVFSSVQYSINHWYQSLPLRDDLYQEKDDLIYLMYLIDNFDDPHGLPRESSRYFRVAEKYLDIFENKPLPAWVKDLWDGVKKKEVTVPEKYQHYERSKF